MQVILSASIDQFQNALGINRRRDDIGKRAAQIDSACTSTPHIVLRVAQEFDRIYHGPTTVASSYSAPEQLQRHTDRHRADLVRFFKNNCIVRLAYEGNKQVGGYVVLNGELLAFHNIRGGVGDWMLRQAISDGAERLDVYAGPAERLYHKWGFREVVRELNHTPGGPDVVWMRLGFGVKREL